jgi:hypothetical protein
MATQSVLSAVKEQRTALMREAGRADRRKLDEYFTLVRRLEQQIALQRQPLAPADGATASGRGGDADVGQARTNHKLFTDLLAMAVASNQTRVVNLVYSASGNPRMRRAPFAPRGARYQAPAHETAKAEEPHELLLEKPWSDLDYFLKTFSSIKEGDRSLLDSMLVLIHSDTDTSRTHTIDRIPIMLAGKAGGRIKSGIHVPGGAKPVTDIGYSAMVAMGVSLSAWGTRSLRATQPISEIMA